ncbi:MAG: low specificity L-threonine aldolase [Actinobacteria bacterium]|nr:low specificity L-threonine aldolase [Actinomycetota bacterium]
MRLNKNFASDNNSGIHPEILDAIVKANSGHAIAYGDDSYTKFAIEKFKEHFGDGIDVYFVFNGTAANVLGLKVATESFNSIICADVAHVNVDECGAPEKFTGCKLLTIPTSDGKITVDQIKQEMHGIGVEHHSQPKVVSITQSTELGTVYTPEEISKIAGFVHEHGMLLHMDGARISNAAASLDVRLRDITSDVGVDILSFGGTKNGMMLGEAVIFFNKDRSHNFKYIRKQGMQLASKMRFISVQFIALFSNDLWLRNARHSNEMAKLLAEKVGEIPQIKITQKVEANAVFAMVPKRCISTLQERYFFYVWSAETSEVRWMTTFDTTEENVKDFVNCIRATLGSS